MLIKAILLGLVGIVGVIDSRLIGRQNIGRPLILSTLAGLVLGDVRQGVILGASLELISMGFVAIGAAGPPNMQFGSIIATAFAILSGASTEAALTIAVPVAVIGEFLSVIMRMVIAQFSHVADKAIENGQFKKAIHIHLWWSFGFNALVYFIPIFLTVYFGTDLVTNLVAAIPQAITNGLTVAGNLLSALGFAMLLSSMLSKKMFPYFLLGFLIVAYSGLSLIGVTMFAAILAFILIRFCMERGKCIMENQKALKKVSDKDLRKVFLHSSRLCAHGTMSVRCTWASCMAWHRCLTSCMQMMRREKGSVSAAYGVL